MPLPSDGGSEGEVPVEPGLVEVIGGGGGTDEEAEAEVSNGDGCRSEVSFVELPLLISSVTVTVPDLLPLLVWESIVVLVVAVLLSVVEGAESTSMG